MREIQIAQNKTLKLTNVLARKIEAEEFANLQIVLTQMQNFMKSNNAQPIGPMIQSGLASQKLNIFAFENELELNGNVYTIFVNQDDDDAVVDVFMETK